MLNNLVSVDFDPISIQHLDKLLKKCKWNWIRRRGGIRRIEKLHRSRSLLNRLNPRSKNVFFMLPKIKNSSTSKNSLKIGDRDHTIYKLSLPHPMMSPSIGTSSNTMLATTAIMDPGSGYNITSRPTIPLGWQRLVCLYYKFSTVWGCQRKFPTHFVSHCPTYMIWKSCQRDLPF